MAPTREEELQKKREEAERKARRGEIDPTHEFTIQVRSFTHSLRVISKHCIINYFNYDRLWRN